MISFGAVKDSTNDIMSTGSLSTTQDNANALGGTILYLGGFGRRLGKLQRLHVNGIRKNRFDNRVQFIG